MHNKKIPTVLGVFIVLILIGVLYVATGNVSKVTTFLSRASESIPPSSPIEIANTTDSSFTVFWTTDEPTGGAVFYGTTPELDDGVAVDERDRTGGGEKFQSHFVKVDGLSEGTKYYFKVGDTEPSFGASDNSPIEITTGPRLPSVTEAEDITGKVVSSGTTPKTDAVASWQSPGSTKIASLVSSDGSYVLPISLARTTDLNSVFIPEVGSPEKILIVSGGSVAAINCLSGDSVAMPEIKMGQTINCNSEVASETIDEDNTTKDEGFGSFGSLLKPVSNTPSSTTTTTNTSSALNIEQGETVSTGLPTFAGKVGPKQVIKIEVHSDEVYSGTVIASPNGSWSWTPPANLTPGEHEVTITIINANGTTQTVTRKFIVSGNGPIMPITSGTPSGQTTLTPTPVPTQAILVESGVELPTFATLTIGLLFTTLSVVAVLFAI